MSKSPAIVALKAIINQLDNLEKELKLIDMDSSPSIAESAKFMMHTCITERLMTLEFVLIEAKDPTGTLKAISEFSGEFTNRTFIAHVTGKLESDDLIKSLRKFAEGHLPLLTNQH
ncbi:hypothetical protein [Vibrio scophthalmi]|uniref:Uncharacterized protein n=1 Tax=Vibrio scophthalmi TaxID=45658 RepID=A0A1E3WI54_9VIBR|nr:hypothetical protein [Vibrio scophthalmi]ODS05222.1 hypothetical protein VSF3289_04363 [Vibrio scophthalmi]ODS12575.1 hypothetical protein VSF3289_02900 [Vibrio scophthalmi]